MSLSNRKHLASIGASLALLISQPSLAQAVPDDIGALQRQVEDLQQREAAAVQRVNELEARLERLEQSRISDFDAAELRGKYAYPTARAWADEPSLAFFQREDVPETGNGQGISSDGAEEDRKAPAPTEAVTELTQQRQGRFGDRIGIELGASYSHFDNARLNLSGFLALDAIFLGRISIDQVTADIFSFDPVLRLGLSNRLFLDANLSYLYRTSNFQSGGAGADASGLIEKRVKDHGIGDLNIGASYRLFRERGGRPDIVINTRVKAPTGKHPYGVELIQVAGSEGNLTVPERLSTGSGVWGASIGVSALKTLDPMVVFGSITYFHNFKRNFSDIDEAPGQQPGRVAVGDAIQIGAGMAYALNDRSSISMSYTQRLVQRTKVAREGQDMQRIVGSQANVGLVNLGATFSLSNRLSLITNVGIGLTDDSPDMAVSVRLPYRF